MNSGSFEHADSAYESGNLDVHTDGTYSHDAPGTIIFAQQLKTGEGGDSVLVDGFAAARDFQADEPVNNYVPPEALSTRERDMLIDAFKAIAALRDRVRTEFTGDVF